MSKSASESRPSTQPSTPPSDHRLDVPPIVAALRAHFATGATRSLAWRLRQLRGLRELLLTHSADFEAALASDLAKNATESQVTEIGFVIAEIDHTISNLRRWLRPQRVAVPLALLPAKAVTVLEPVGVVLIIAPWNYPVQLLLGPLVGALAAGNTAVVKPSELAPATSAVFARLLPRFVDRRAVAVVEGAVAETTALLAERFDHIFYTGNGRVARIVAAAAAVNLTPVTLELGGKSPVFVDNTVDLAATARRIVWGKFINAGQTCVAPDYVVATPDVASRLEQHLQDAITEFYGADPSTSADFGRIVNERQFDRLVGLLSDQAVVVGGQHDRKTNYLAPTVLRDVALDAEIMQQEIFGPILPILAVPTVSAAIELISAADKPLALYVFSNSEHTRKRFLRETSSGAVGFNVPAAHLSVHGLPFGGVGESGSGAYHGKRSLEVFSHTKAVFSKPLTPDTLGLVYPPYTAQKDSFVRGLFRKLT
jgi:aldehyde dehydrogenase (NAD+)